MAVISIAINNNNMMDSTQNTVQLTERFEQALIYANRLHADQVRKLSGVPYISHLLSVAALVLEDGGTEDEAIAALLHDAIEDQGGEATRQIIYEKFGASVVDIIDGCTESSDVPKPAWKQRKLQYLQQIQSASVSVRRVSLADKLHNARSLVMDLRLRGNVAWNYFNASPQEVLWFYQSLLQVYQTAGTDAMTEALQMMALELETLGRSALSMS